MTRRSGSCDLISSQSFSDPDSVSIFHRVLLEREESRDSLDPLASRCVALVKVEKLLLTTAAKAQDSVRSIDGLQVTRKHKN